MLGRLKARGREVKDAAKAATAKAVTAVVTTREEDVVTVAHVAQRDSPSGQRSLVLVPRAQGHASLEVRSVFDGFSLDFRWLIVG